MSAIAEARRLVQVTRDTDAWPQVRDAIEVVAAHVELMLVGGQVTELQQQIHDMAVSKGWWNKHKSPEMRRRPESADSIGSKLALIHSEISEALEFVRDGGPYEPTMIDGKPEGVAIELADVVIRVMDLCGALGLDLESAILQKVEFNRGRKHRHGGRLL